MPEIQETKEIVTSKTPLRNRTIRRVNASAIRITKVSVEKTTRGLIVKLPLVAADYLQITDADTEIFATPVNGVVQLSSFQPNIAIPASRISEDDFVEQS